MYKLNKKRDNFNYLPFKPILPFLKPNNLTVKLRLKGKQLHKHRIRCKALH